MGEAEGRRPEHSRLWVMLNIVLILNTIVQQKESWKGHSQKEVPISKPSKFG